MTNGLKQGDLHVRPARGEDGAALAILHRDAILATSTVFYSNEERQSWAAGLRADGYARAMSNGEVIEVAVNDSDVPVAFCGRRKASIEAVYVHPDYQHRGIGSLLLKRAEAALAGAGDRSLRVDASLSAIAFYQRHGYERAEDRTHKTRGGLELAIVRMTKVLA